MEHENAYASKGVGGTALGLSIGALGAEVLGGTLGNLFGNNRNCSGNDAPVSRYEASLTAENAELKTEIKLRDSNIYTDGKILELYRYVDGKFAGVEAQINAQAVYNATNNAALNCLNGQVAQLMGLTKLVVPNSSICPGWGNVTVTPSTTTT